MRNLDKKIKRESTVIVKGTLLLFCLDGNNLNTLISEEKKFGECQGGSKESTNNADRRKR